MAKRPTSRPPAPAPSRAASAGGPDRAPVGVILGIVALVVLGVGMIAFAASRSGDDDTTARGGSTDDAASDSTDGDSGEGVALEQTRPVAVTGDALAPFGEGDDTAIGATAPTLAGASFDGTAVTIEPGQPTLVVFLAHWCPHCQREVPVLVDWFESGGVPEGVQIVGVATSTDSSLPNYPPSDWLDDEGFPWPVMADTEDQVAAAAMGLSGYPYFVLLDADGVVVQRASGEIEPEVLQGQIEDLLASA